MTWTLILAVLPATIAAIASVITSILNRYAIQDIHLSVNSRLSELLRVTAVAAHAEGHMEGQANKNASPAS
jgi:hypothetical protein